MASDVVRLICPNLKCKSILAVPGSARGKIVRCRQCGARVRVPVPAATSQETGEHHQNTGAGAAPTPEAHAG